MKRNSMRSLLSVFLCTVLIAAMALFAVGCTDNTTPTEPSSPSETPNQAAASFTFLVVDLDGTETSFQISTDEATVGDALLAEGLIEGEESEYGLYVKTVKDIPADYDVDETYWAFYINGEYAMTGVDVTEVTDGATYSFVKTGPEQTSNVLGEGSTVFTFNVVDLEGNETSYEIHTDETTVGAALLALELIAGEEGEYGLYVKTVCGTTLDYDADGKYWGFYIDGEYAMTGVDVTEITAGAVYTFKAE